MTVRVTPSSDEQEIRRVAQELFAARAPLTGHRDRTDVRPTPPRELFAQMGELGFFAASSPDLGGVADAPLATAMILEAAGRELVVGPLIDQILAVRLLARDDELRRALTAGTALAAVGFTAARGVRGDSRIGTVSGKAAGLAFGRSVDRWLLPVAGPGAHEATVAVVSPTSPGVGLQADGPSIDPLWSSDAADLRDVAPLAVVTASRAEIDGHLSYGGALVAAYALGAAQRALDDAVVYVKQRRQFGRAVGSFQAVKHLAADAYVALLHARCLTYVALGPEGDADKQRLARIAADRAYRKIAETALQMHGGIGFTAESTVHLFLKGAQRMRAWPVPTLDLLDQTRRSLGLGLDEDRSRSAKESGG